MITILKRHARMAVAAPLVAVAAAFAVYGPATALDVDQTRNTVARVNTTQQTNYYRFTVNYNDPRMASSAQKFGRLLRNTFINSIACHVTTAFNAGTLNVFTVGTSLSASELIDASTSTRSIDETSATYQAITSAASLGLAQTSAADVDLYARYTQTGTAATAGVVTCVISYTPNNDM